MSELSFVPDYGVVPTRAQFDEAVARLEWHLEAQKRIKLTGLGPEVLAAEYDRYQRAYDAYRHFESFVVHHFMRDWWRIDPIADVDRVRRRANRQHNLNIQHLVAIKSALVAHGPAGIEAIKGLFLTGEPRLVSTFSEIACDHFPDEAEPVFEALAAAEDEPLSQEYYERWLRQIRGYRLRRAGDLAPELQVGEDAGLAPALATLDRSPAALPTELFAAFAHHVFTGELCFDEAVDTAWRQLVAERRLDPKYLEIADLAAFDDRHKSTMTDAVHKAYGDRPYAHGLASYGFAYVRPDGQAVTLEEQAEALYRVVRYSHSEPYVPATTWQKVEGPGKV